MSLNPNPTLTPALSITEALLNGLTLIKNEQWRYHQQKSIESGWEKFRALRYPELESWWDVRPIHIFNFIAWMEDERGWKPNTVSHYVNPLRKASHWAQLHFPDQWKNPFVRKMRRNASIILSEHFLMPDQLATAIDQAKRMNQPAVVAALVIGGLGGLGIAEMADLHAEHIGNDGTLTVLRAKNAYRPRVIPCCEHLALFCRAFKAVHSKIPGRRSELGLNKKARKVLNATAERTGDETFARVDLHESTRVTFANLAKRAGVKREDLAAFMGHVGESTLERSYLHLVPRPQDLPRIKEAKIEHMREAVCAPMNKALRDMVFF